MNGLNVNAKKMEHQDRDGNLARIIGEMRGEIENLRAEIKTLRQAVREHQTTTLEYYGIIGSYPNEMDRELWRAVFPNEEEP